MDLLKKKPEDPPKSSKESFNPYRESAQIEPDEPETIEYRKKHNWDDNKVCKRCGSKWNDIVKKVGTHGIADEVLRTQKSIKEIITERVNADWCLDEIERMIQDIIT